MTPNTILWIYIGLLVAGGLMGFLKAKSKISLTSSLVFAAALSLCALDLVAQPRLIADILLVALMIFFGIRLSKTRKFMPAGLMVILTIAALILRNV